MTEIPGTEVHPAVRDAVEALRKGTYDPVVSLMAGRAVEEGAAVPPAADLWWPHREAELYEQQGAAAPEYVRLAARYPCIVVWGRSLAWSQYALIEELRRAAETAAPRDAVHEHRHPLTGERTGRWARVPDIPAERRQRMGWL